MSAESLWGAEGMIYLLAALHRSKRGHGKCRFPNSPEWEHVSLHCDLLNPRQFFRRLVIAATQTPIPDRNAVRRVIEKCQFAEGVAVFLELTWEDTKINQCSIQAIVAPEHDLETLYWTRRCRAHYYRMDYSVEERGKLFDHPFPHVHSEPDGPPRFHFNLGSNVFPAFALLDFIMRSRHHGRWLQWLLAEYSKRHPGDVPEGERTPDQLAEDYKEADRWMRSTESSRSRFLTQMKNASLRALQDASEGFPKVDPELLKLNYSA